MYISGSIGYTLLKQKSETNIKYVLLLADVHDGVQYCQQDSIMIDEWLNSKDNNNILLEEAVRENLHLTDLWPGAQHTQRLKKLNQTNYKIKPIDIRPLLLPFSWELAEMNEKLSSITLKEYINNISDLFNLKTTKFLLKYIVPEVKLIQNNQKFRVSLLTHFNEMKEIFNEYVNDNNKYMNYSIIKLYKINKDILEKINNQISMIMEWYVLLLIHNSNMNTILHLGLAHTNRILDLLTEVYQFDIIKEQGITHMNNINDNMKACILVPPDITNLFNSKYYI
jgi:hypothetical protein